MANLSWQRRYYVRGRQMAVIGWHSKPDAWVVAGWAFRQVLEDVRALGSSDVEMISEVERAMELKYLFIDSFNPELVARLVNAVRDVASGTLSGKVRSGLADKPYGTADTVNEYRNSMKELVAVISDHCEVP